MTLLRVIGPGEERWYGPVEGMPLVEAVDEKGRRCWVRLPNDTTSHWIVTWRPAAPRPAPRWTERLAARVGVFRFRLARAWAVLRGDDDD